METCQVTALWNDENGVWRAEAEEVPGLIVEAATVEALLQVFHERIPDLVNLRLHLGPTARVVPFSLVVEERQWASQAAL
jgi:hypothetical protein